MDTFQQIMAFSTLTALMGGAALKAPSIFPSFAFSFSAIGGVIVTTGIAEKAIVKKILDLDAGFSPDQIHKISSTVSSPPVPYGLLASLVFSAIVIAVYAHIDLERKKLRSKIEDQK